MYGAVLRQKTELVESGDAHVGVLFLTNEGYSTMCGHATLAVARLLVDQAGSESAPIFELASKRRLEPDLEAKQVKVDLHVPCGLVHVTVPIITQDEGKQWRTDANRPISYLSVPSYATGIEITVNIPPSFSWPELDGRDSVIVDIAYGGAFYIIASPADLGFPKSLAQPDLAALDAATRRLKAAFNSSSQLRKSYLQPSEHPDLEFLYGTILTDADLGVPENGTAGAETSLCFFSNGQVDRSPTGSGVQAKVALAYAKGTRSSGERWTYHSLVSNWATSRSTSSEVNGSLDQLRNDKSAESTSPAKSRSEGAFVGAAVEEGNVNGTTSVIVRVSGWARYTGASSFVVEDGDSIGKGFWFEGMGSPRGSGLD